MTILYCTQVTKVGEFAIDSLNENMMILFDDNAPADVADYCFIHPHVELKGEIKVEGDFVLGQSRYPITAVGDVVNQNLGELGHITIRFDGATEAEYPGTVHVQGNCPTGLEVGTAIVFKLNN
ncbi:MULTISPECIES: PTS glucitol/sorbitol transporter subunit IIA [Aeromonas]|uniref:PTS glucitol/sorbitol transporter subunit IIA n=1 Tax=Aeromonas caviae TaxID=648 RepID=A0A7T4C2H6_AERCA|nr:PTS glucitol/sorbitol transporter subunit IIA [Aeromonas caviae]QQA60047.1 PTS glucitol/sorbitol transporter subunit IIA [Aeromonas caviae]